MALFAQFEGIPGESRDADHSEWSDVLTLEWNVIRRTHGTAIVAHGRGRVNFEDVLITKPFDTASTALLRAMMDNQVIPVIKFHDTATYGDGARRMYLEIELRRAMVSSRRCKAPSEGRAMPVEELTFTFEEYNETYIQFDATGQQRNAMTISWIVQDGDRA